MIRYQNIHGYSVNFTPWLDLGYRLVSLEMRERIGGDLAEGSIRMVGSLSQLESLELKNTYSGTVTILDFGVPVREFKVFFVRKSYKREEITLDFVCIPLPDYVRDLHTKTHVGDLRSIIEGIFTHAYAKDFLDIRCDSDIQGTMRLYQFLVAACFGWAVFAFTSTRGIIVISESLPSSRALSISESVCASSMLKLPC